MGYAQLVIDPAGSGKVNDYSTVSFIRLDLRKERSMQYVVSQIDSCSQYEEDADMKSRDLIRRMMSNYTLLPVYLIISKYQSTQ